ncbi:MAG TPA: 5-oxoprolinase subunit PxpB [Syntrophales bacterium]|jgi:KipI family sensor histidine kinase inhibitor|nr:5-oxoprolinase subunit PxpB [Syntrophales bacterium]HON23598.1 5-oxoprolinase subunit PxpB [Syntrophales bacterium]HOU77127.1 5-oxoprolinase subunit PxpB [Syntrophales bacterium]HPC33705.1 5-oxoprolinase subunit PxpB [Syntrophales bacterium]HQG33655.1 5-oxoprolinase subunit PxpB [Syntrophales bacterium]
MIVQPYAENALRIIFGNSIDLKIHDRVRRAFFICRALKHQYILEIVPSFCACVITYDEDKTSFAELADLLRERLLDLSAVEMPPPRVHEIPVRYGGEYGPDLAFVARHCHLSPEEVIARHTATTYTVYTVGFTPGFPYLGNLDEALDTPRLETPRTRIPAGSVGIAQRQTGIYPFESPAGWRIIGRTSVRLFDTTQSPYSLMEIGDKVRFYEVS